MEALDRTMIHSVNVAIGAEVRAWLGRRGHNQRWLADQLGIAAMGVTRRLRGETSFSPVELLIIAQRLDITLGQLLGHELINEKDPDLGSGEGFGGNVLMNSRL